jgi:5-(aminomethyl)-3-furanmethanol phosphate kinase
MDATAVKIGGSLALYPEKLRELCTKLSELSKTHKLIVVPGGGEFADLARDYDKRFNLSGKASHQIAILGMDQYGLVLSDLISNSCLVNKLEKVQKLLELSKLPVFLPSDFMLNSDPLANSWDVTSDSITICVARQLSVRKVVLVTDVDGIFTGDPKKCSDAKLYKRLFAKELLTMEKRTSVDKVLARLLLQFQIECFVVNGLYPERVEAILNKQETVCTLIT